MEVDGYPSDLQAFPAAASYRPPHGGYAQPRIWKDWCQELAGLAALGGTAGDLSMAANPVAYEAAIKRRSAEELLVPGKRPCFGIGLLGSLLVSGAAGQPAQVFGATLLGKRTWSAAFPGGTE
ncbi:unnamed protein product [Prorocentrum cordatum]|uniref:Uncharacterized protein n=1 Tax=Prorocentrum cordatum TaxID=2364126 RepID=A0ABN9VQ96_9DINO|nr:unnamed protein product [Polarella glacialis]